LQLFVKGIIDADESYHARVVLNKEDLAMLCLTGKLKKTIEGQTMYDLGDFIRVNAAPTQRIIEVVVKESDNDETEGSCIGAVACACCS